MVKRPESSRDCMDGTPDEDHDWRYDGGDFSVGIYGAWVCRACGKEDCDREPPSEEPEPPEMDEPRDQY